MVIAGYPKTSSMLEVNMDLEKSLTVGQVAKRSGVSVSALHFYEAKGLIKSMRTAGNQRRYPREILRRVSVIKVAQRVGVPLSQIKQALNVLPSGRSPSVREWKSLSTRWKAELDERIAKLTKLRDQLDQCIGCGCLSIRNCWLRNPWDKLAKEGPGPRLL